jgi:site-specific recombinase XerC
LDELMKRYCAAAGIPADLAHMHSLKHSCGTHVLAMVGDLAAVQDHLGHADIRSTLIYAQFTQRECVAQKLANWGKKAA